MTRNEFILALAIMGASEIKTLGYTQRVKYTINNKVSIYINPEGALTGIKVFFKSKSGKYFDRYKSAFTYLRGNNHDN